MAVKNFKSKEVLMAISGIFIIVLIFYFGVKTFNEMDSNPDLQNAISVSGTGEVFVQPDIAKISLTIEKEAASVTDAQKSAADAANKVIDYLKSSGIEDKDIKTANYSIYPRYDYLEKTGRVLKGYVVNQTLEVKIRKIEEAGKILGGATLAGANQVSGINFIVDDMEAVKREARQKAINNAKEKAKQLAKDLGVRIGHLFNYSEGDNGIVYPMYDAKSVVLAPEIPSGENKIVINVTLTYEIK